MWQILKHFTRTFRRAQTLKLGGVNYSRLSEEIGQTFFLVWTFLASAIKKGRPRPRTQVPRTPSKKTYAPRTSGLQITQRRPPKLTQCSKFRKNVALWGICTLKSGYIEKQGKEQQKEF